MNLRQTLKTPSSLIFALLAILLLAGAALLRAHAAQAEAVLGPAHTQAGQEGSPSQPIEPSNYCLSCHSSQDARLQTATAWDGGITPQSDNPCPAATRIQEELYYTERMLLAIERGMDAIGSQAESSSIQSRYLAAAEGYARLLDTPVDSLDAFESEAQTLRYQMGRLYTQINAIADSQHKQTALVVGAAITLIVLASLIWGLYNTRKMRGSLGRKPRLAYYILVGIFLLLVFGLFALPLFRPVVAKVEEPSLEEQAITTAQDEASRLATAAVRADSRAWMFSRVGAAMQALDPARAQTILESGLDAASQSALNDYAIWGEAARVREASVSNDAKLENAGLIASQLNAARSRAWALALIGAEWAEVDPPRAQEIFNQALTTAQSAAGIYRDLDLRKVAVEWARLDPERGLEVAGQIADPALQSWALREIAQQTGDSQLFTQAAQAARRVQDPLQRARLLREIAELSGEKSLFQESYAALEGQQGAGLAYALGDLAAASGDPAIVEQIDPRYPAARVLALMNLGQFPAAWEASLAIEDPYNRGRAQAAISSAWSGVSGSPAAQKAQEIQIPMLRDRAVRDVIFNTGDASLVELIGLAYYRVQALTGLGRFDSAWEAAAGLKEPFPLVGLGEAWAQSSPDSAARVLDALKREADKAVVLQALAEATGDPQIFERALGMAQAARVRNDPLASAVASLDLSKIALTPGQVLTALEQAYEITERISIK